MSDWEAIINDPIDADEAIIALSVAVEWLERIPITEQPSRAHRQLKKLNGRIWKLIKSLEAHRLAEWYDLNQLMRDMIPHFSPDGSATEVWLAANAAGALEIRPGKLLELAESAGVDIERYRTETP